MEIKVVLVSSDADFNHDLKEVLSREADVELEGSINLKVCDSIPSMKEAVIHFAPHLIIIHMEEDAKTEKIQFLEQLSRIAERIPVVVSAADLSAELMLSCVKKGVRDFLRQPVQEEEVRTLMKRLMREKPVHTKEAEAGVTYAFFSYKGGIGNTFLSCNTAVSIAHLRDARVLLWDMVMQNGDVPFFFDYTPTATLTDLLENLPRIDGQYLQGTLPVQPSGISILSGPKRPEEAESVRNDQIQALHQVLKKHYDYIVVDSGHALTDSIIGLMDNSKHIMLTTNLHLPVLKNTLRCLEVFERLGYTEDKFKILLNRYNSKYEKFDLSKAEEILRYHIAYSVLNDYVTASRSLNAGVPVAELDPNSLLTKQFNGLAELLINDFQVKEKRAGLLKRMFGGSKAAKKKRELRKNDKQDSRSNDDRGQDAA